MKKVLMKQLVSLAILLALTISAGAAERPDIIEGKLLEYKKSVLILKKINGDKVRIRIGDKTYLRSVDHKPVRLDKLPRYTRLYAVVSADGVASNITIQEVSE